MVRLSLFKKIPFVNNNGGSKTMLKTQATFVTVHWRNILKTINIFKMFNKKMNYF